MKAVDPLENSIQIHLVETFLRKHYSDTVGDCWCLGLQLTLRISDLLRLAYRDVKTRAGQKVILLSEDKTGKEKLMTLNKKAVRLIEARRRQNPSHIYIFQSTSQNLTSMTPRPITREYISRALAEAGRQPDIDLPLSSHTMRKTRALAVYRATNDLALVQKLLNHASQETTLRYLGLTQKVVQETYKMEL